MREMPTIGVTFFSQDNQLISNRVHFSYTFAFVYFSGKFLFLMLRIVSYFPKLLESNKIKKVSDTFAYTGTFREGKNPENCRDYPLCIN